MNILTQQQNILFDQVESEDLTYEGQFDGKTKLPPDQTKWQNLSYRNAYLAGLGKFYDKQFQTEHCKQLAF